MLRIHSKTTKFTQNRTEINKNVQCVHLDFLLAQFASYTLREPAILQFVKSQKDEIFLEFTDLIHRGCDNLLHWLKESSINSRNSKRPTWPSIDFMAAKSEEM